MPHQTPGIPIRNSQLLGGIQGEKSFDAGVGQEPEKNCQEDTQATLVSILNHLLQTLEHIRLFLNFPELLRFLDKDKNQNCCQDNQSGAHPERESNIDLIQGAANQ